MAEEHPAMFEKNEKMIVSIIEDEINRCAPHEHQDIL